MYVYGNLFAILLDIQEFYEASLENNEKSTEPSKPKTREVRPPVNEWNFTSPTSTTVPKETVPSNQSDEVSKNV